MSILEKLIVVGINVTEPDQVIGTNCYLVGTEKTQEIFIIDPGYEPKTIITRIGHLKLIPKAVILTHTHSDHVSALKEVIDHFKIPVWYNEKERDVRGIICDKWLREGDLLQLGELSFYFLNTIGHTRGGISIYTKDINQFRDKAYDGIIFTGDCIFRRSIARVFSKKNEVLLCNNIKEKLMYNPDLTDNFLILPGHMNITTIGEEKRLNPFAEKFLTLEDWQHNKYFGKDIKQALCTPVEERP